MAAMRPSDGSQAGPGGTGLRPCVSNMHDANRPDVRQHPVIYTQNCVQDPFAERGVHKNNTPAPPQSEAERGWSNLRTRTPAADQCVVSASGEPLYSLRSPESVEMDEIMAAMVLTSLSCNPMVQSPPQTETGTAGCSSSADMECGGGELSDSGSSGYWSWDHGNVSPAPSPSVPEMDSSPDEGLNMELEQGEELHAKKPKGSFKGLYKCLWPSCGKVLTSSVGIKRHIRVLHLGGSDQSQREEDFYYTKISCETVDSNVALLPSQPALGQMSPLSWASCASPPALGVQIPPAHRPRSNSSSGPGASRPSPLSQSAPSSFWQIHTEHLYQACSPVQAGPPVAPRSPGCHGLTTPASVSSHSNAPMAKPRCRSVSVGEQWLQQNRLQTMSASPSRAHCAFRKGRGEAKKCRKVYGVERKDQWCTACRWKKACQRFPD
ncbi:zinc finger protein 395b isoform X2 [Dunckerocampus dactyliophorus]|uniref:zinc finger protein 395b isoform X2 n=1 Tax=Dunckerocampus dactyliophorus TaxID=161453 RepID=UPI002406BCDE|nr:zinc finger protein 395b isoform X2 [Dunckerocampus dactyliophorus]